MTVYIDTCVLPRARLETARVYRELFGPSLGFELTMMFDLPDFEENLTRNLDLFRSGPLMFHEPVWGVEHSAPRGSAAWEEGMYHLRLTKKFAGLLKPSSMVFHLNNGVIPPGRKEIMLQTALQNLEDMREMFSGVQILVENTGIRKDGTQLLDQQEFTDLCRSEHFPVLIDVGHACANRWNLPRLIRDLKGQIGGFHLHNNDGAHDLHNRLRDGVLDLEAILPCIVHDAPDAALVIEYTRPMYHGDPVIRDVEYLRQLLSREGEEQ